MEKSEADGVRQFQRLGGERANPSKTRKTNRGGKRRKRKRFEPALRAYALSRAAQGQRSKKQRRKRTTGGWKGKMARRMAFASSNVWGEKGRTRPRPGRRAGAAGGLAGAHGAAAADREDARDGGRGPRGRRGGASRRGADSGGAAAAVAGGPGAGAVPGRLAGPARSRVLVEMDVER
jgi:hypothetical protein